MKKLFLGGLIIFMIGIGGLMLTTVQGNGLSFSSMFGERLPFEDEKVFEKDNIKHINVDVASSDVNILPSDTDEITVRYYGKADKNSLENRSLQTDLSQDTLDIHIHNKRTFSIGFTYVNQQIDVMIPSQTIKSLNVNGASSDITLKSFQSEQIEFDLASGDVQLNNVESNLITVNTSSGSVDGEDITGEMRVKTSSGDTNLHLKAIKHPLDISSSSGDVEIDIASEPTNMKLNYSSSSGEADINFPLKYDSLDRSNIQATIGSGNPDVTIRTSSGDLTFNLTN
ncbi:DUF4097 family beta strand repeat protein [Pontibacillus yanchengensis]|uniref:DUF4097 family beta strand repeat protein n=2 Tax=Pontibacillus yanchengensis TaxID=462910 RepID=A0ACC7VGR5_9BACI|nr:DUF4097 family beta strand repeat-containing protein [Pontibacillus yanchengensis]MYL33645.1 DUF4097 family beta strand repeat protein [Pontibacillus yanchengensis]MYL54158.1 DUF4097 family beta strand repeat protein [Pontibacillus yanchengensis]